MLFTDSQCIILKLQATSHGTLLITIVRYSSFTSHLFFSSFFFLFSFALCRAARLNVWLEIGSDCQRCSAAWHFCTEHSLQVVLASPRLRGYRSWILEARDAIAPIRSLGDSSFLSAPDIPKSSHSRGFSSFAVPDIACTSKAAHLLPSGSNRLDCLLLLCPLPATARGWQRHGWFSLLGSGDRGESGFDGWYCHGCPDVGHRSMGPRSEMASSLGWRCQPGLKKRQCQDSRHQRILVERSLGSGVLSFPLYVVLLVPRIFSSLSETRGRE